MAAVVLAVAVAASGCQSSSDQGPDRPVAGSSHLPSPSSASVTTDSASPRPRASSSDSSPMSTSTSAASSSATGADDRVAHVVIVSIDGLNPTALDLGALPTFARMVREGSGTLNARTDYESTVTLPNHASMLTGRPVDPRQGGHGVRIDVSTSKSVQELAGTEVASVFDVVHDAGGSTAAYVSKDKFDLFERSWPTSIDRYAFVADNDRLTDTVVTDLRREQWSLAFVHLSGPDVAGHGSGWLSRDYRAAVSRADGDLGRLIGGIESTPGLRGSTVLLVTADHGGTGDQHGAKTLPADYTIPLLAWGAGVPAGRDLYQLNPDYADPGRSRPAYAGPSPIRNGDVANLATSLLGLGPVPGSVFDAEQDLTVTGR